MASLSFIVGIIGNIVSILVFASPIKTFWWVVKKKSTEDYKSVPYITTFLSTSLWTFYGVLKPGGLLIATVNGAGAVLQLTYVILFITYAPKDKKIKTAKLAGLLDIGLLGTVIVVSLFAIHKSGLRLTFIGFICAGLTLGMYGSPFFAVGIVIKTKSVEYVPFLLSLFLFINGGVWSVYALLVKDFFVGMPNAIGFVLGSAQLILYAIYKKKSASTEDTMEEEGQGSMKKESTEMQSLDGDKSLSKSGGSLGSQKSLQKIVRNLSLGPYELQHYSSSSFKSQHESDPTR